ncbi:DUF222 domain-containing protein [Luteococcus peritonei]|uniref:DUF222 domain-containing protein n=1 Tax=Luteococcus peritonei TaxID=88874 RepID=A0ABW4RWQ2_9ACTN
MTSTVIGQVVPLAAHPAELVSSAQTVDAMMTARRRAWMAEAESFMLAAHFADLHAVVDASGIALPGAERLVRLGGDGTPEVAEFAPLEIAAALTISVEAARVMIGDALDLRHRFPALWNLLGDGQLRVGTARQIVNLARQLPLPQARELDARLAPLAGGISTTRLLTITEGLVLELLPADLAEARRLAALDARRVDVGSSRDGVTDVWAVLDAGDARFLDAQVDRLAAILADGGSTDSLDARRALGLGLLATPARALQLLQASLLDQIPTLTADGDLDAGCPARGQRGHTCGTITVEPDKLLPKADLVVHISANTACELDGIARIEKLGPVIAESLAVLLADTRLTIRPVIDPATITACDRYEVPTRMRELVQLRHLIEAFPGSHRSATGCDLDHTIPWPRTKTGHGTGHSGMEHRPGVEQRETAGPPGPPGWESSDPPGPPGGTRPDNLAPLSRTVHRAKTHGGWRYQTLLPDCHLWRSPDGFAYLVTPQRSWMVHNPVAA